MGEPWEDITFDKRVIQDVKETIIVAILLHLIINQ